MEINRSILVKAKAKLEKEKKEKEYIETCIKAKMCPVCGKSLIDFTKEVDEYVNHIGLKCSKNEDHYIEYDIYDYYED